jgi:Asp-tRNA(Asn)/Glu-tRNA(Gln) amidotransferase A subunit family amidase
VFARTVEDAALVAEQIMAFDDRDPDMRPGARPLVGALAEEPPVKPRLAFVKTPVWTRPTWIPRWRLALVARLGRTSSRSNFRRCSVTRSRFTA